MLGIFRELTRVFSHSEHGGSHIFELTASPPQPQMKMSGVGGEELISGKGHFAWKYSTTKEKITARVAEKVLEWDEIHVYLC